MLTRINNGQRAGKKVIYSHKSKLQSNVLDVLVREGYIRAHAAEALLTGHTIDERTARAAAKAAMQSATPLSQNAFKTQLFQTAIYRTVLLAAGQMQRDPSSIG